MGGHVSGLFAVQEPERVDRLILVNAGYGLALPEVTNAADLGHAAVPGGLRALKPATRTGARDLLAMVFHDKERFLSSQSVDEFFTQRLAAWDGGTIQSISESWARRENVLTRYCQPSLSRVSWSCNHDTIRWRRYPSENACTPAFRGRYERFLKSLATRLHSRGLPNSTVSFSAFCNPSRFAGRYYRALITVLHQRKRTIDAPSIRSSVGGCGPKNSSQDDIGNSPVADFRVP